MPSTLKWNLRPIPTKYNPLFLQGRDLHRKSEKINQLKTKWKTSLTRTIYYYINIKLLFTVAHNYDVINILAIFSHGISFENPHWQRHHSIHLKTKVIYRRQNSSSADDCKSWRKQIWRRYLGKKWSQPVGTKSSCRAGWSRVWTSLTCKVGKYPCLTWLAMWHSQPSQISQYTESNRGVLSL